MNLRKFAFFLLATALLGLICSLFYYQTGVQGFKQENERATELRKMRALVGGWGRGAGDFEAMEIERAKKERSDAGKTGILVFVGVGILGAGLIFASNGTAEADLTPEQKNERRFKAAIDNGDMATVSEMLDSGAIDPNGGLTKSRNSWLRYAMTLDKLEVCELLLKRGADPNKVDGFGISPLKTLVNLTPTKGSTERAILDLFRNPPSVEVVARPGPLPVSSSHAPEKKTVAQQLSELARLKEAGHLSTEEYELAKARVLA